MTILLLIYLLLLVSLVWLPTRNKVCGLNYSQCRELQLEYSLSEYATQRLAEITKKHKLKQLIDAADELHAIVLFTDLIDRGAYCLHDENFGHPVVVLSEDSFVEGVSYQEQLAHELGHVYAMQFGMDWSDEQLAWDIAEGLMIKTYGRLTPTWAASRAACLATYGISEASTTTARPVVTVIYQKKSIIDRLLVALRIQ